MKNKDDDKIDNNIPSLLQLVPLCGPVAKVDKSHWFLSLFQTILVNTFLILFCFFSILFIILHLFHHGQTNQYLQIVFFLYFFIVFSFCSSLSTSFTMIRPRMHSCHHQPWCHLLVNSGGLSASASDLVSAFGPCLLWTRWHHTLDGAHFY